MKSPTPNDNATLRQRAEAKVALGDLPTKLGLRDPMRLLHELQVHQIELEMQNEELSASIRANEAQRAKFQALYELAPIAILTLSATGRILECNARAMKLLGETDRERMYNRSLLSYVRNDRLEKLSDLLHAALVHGDAMTDDLALTGLHPLPVYVQVEVHALPSSDEVRPVLLVAMMDVTALRQIKEDMAAVIAEREEGRRSRRTAVKEDTLTEMEWVVRFLRRLDQLLPDLAPPDAAAFAYGAFASAAGQEPETKAEWLAQERTASSGET